MTEFTQSAVIAYLKGSSKRTLTKILTEVFECKRHEFAGCRICSIKFHRNVANKIKQCDNCGIISSYKDFVSCDAVDCGFQLCLQCEEELMNFPSCKVCELKVRECDYCRSAPKQFQHRDCGGANYLEKISPKALSSSNSAKHKLAGFNIFNPGTTPKKESAVKPRKTIVTPRDRQTQRDFSRDHSVSFSPRDQFNNVVVASKSELECSKTRGRIFPRSTSVRALVKTSPSASPTSSDDSESPRRRSNSEPHIPPLHLENLAPEDVCLLQTVNEITV